MPGAKKVIIDVVAAAASIGSSPPPVKPAPLPVPPATVKAPPASPGQCALGHDNAPEVRFCGTCGLPMTAQAPQARVNLEDARPKPWSQLKIGRAHV